MTKISVTAVQRTSVLAILFSIVAQNAKTQVSEFQPIADFAPASITFDEPGGRYDEWTKLLPCGANRASVMVRFDSRSPNSAWGPRATVILNPLDKQPESSSSESAAAAIMPSFFYREDIPSRLSVEKYVGISPVTVIPIRRFSYSNPMKVDMAWSSDGVVVATFADKYSASIKMEKPITAIALSASSAKVEFLDLQVGHEGAVSDCKTNQ